MKGRFWISDTDFANLDMTLSITMKMEEWEEVRGELQNAKKYSATSFARFVGGAVTDLKLATDKFVSEPAGEDE